MAFRSISTIVSGVTLSVPPPSGVQDGDILIAFAFVDASTQVFSWPAGFVVPSGAPLQSASPDGETLGCAIKVANGESGNYAIGGTNSINGGIICLSGRDPVTTPYRISTNIVTSASASPWNLTSSAFSTALDKNGCDLVMLAIDDIVAAISGALHAPPAGFTERAEMDFNGGFEAGEVSTMDNAVYGHTGVATAVGTLATKTSGGRIIMLAFAPVKLGDGGIVTDDFNRADENPLTDGGKWMPSAASIGGGKVVSNHATPITSSTGESAVRVSHQFDDDHWSEITYDSSDIAAGFDNGVSVRARAQTGSTNFGYNYSVGDGALYRNGGTGGFATLATISPGTVAAGDVYRLEVKGLKLTVFKNGIQIGTFTDTGEVILASGGSPGMDLYAHTINTWRGGNFFTGYPQSPSGNVVQKDVSHQHRRGYD